MELKKSYKGFIGWMLIFCLAMVAVMLLPIQDIGIIFRLVLHVCTISITILTGIIYCTESIYWYNGISYEEAHRVGSQRRKAYAWCIFKQFAFYTFMLLVVSIFAYLFKISYWVDFIIVMIGIVVCIIRTTRFKL